MITKLDTATAVIESLPDPPENPDMQQTRHLVQAHSTLGSHFGKRDDVLVAGEGYLIVCIGSVEDWGQHFYPDCVVAFGVEPKAIIARNGYVTSEVGKPPEFVLEIASETTASHDETVKREGYAELGVSEYWRFDGSGKGLYSQPLSGDRLAGDAYEPIELTEEADGEVRGYSRALSLYLCSDENRLRFWDPETQKYLRPPTSKRWRNGIRREPPASKPKTALPKPKPKLRGSRIGLAVSDGAERLSILNFAFPASTRCDCPVGVGRSFESHATMRTVRHLFGPSTISWQGAISEQ